MLFWPHGCTQGLVHLGQHTVRRGCLCIAPCSLSPCNVMLPVAFGFPRAPRFSYVATPPASHVYHYRAGQSVTIILKTSALVSTLSARTTSSQLPWERGVRASKLGGGIGVGRRWYGGGMTSALSLPSPLSRVPELPEVTETQGTGTGQTSARVWVLHAVSQFRSH